MSLTGWWVATLKSLCWVGSFVMLAKVSDSLDA